MLDVKLDDKFMFALYHFIIFHLNSNLLLTES